MKNNRRQNDFKTMLGAAGEPEVGNAERNSQGMATRKIIHTTSGDPGNARVLIRA
jgi:hypothetical protein